MPITIGEDTYITVVEADEYLGSRYGFESWELLDELQKEKALVSATSVLDTLCVWYGLPITEDQKLAFPRTTFGPDVPDAIKSCEAEIAFLITVNGSGTNTGETDVLTKLKAGDVEMEFAGKTQVLEGNTNPYVEKLLSVFGYCQFGKTNVIPVFRN